MKTFDSYDLLITPLSPVHIGTGESYEPTNYVIEDDTLHEFDTGEVVELLSKADKDALLQAVDRRPNQDMIKAVQRFFYERRPALITHSRNSIPVLAGVAGLYHDRVGQTAQREESGRQIINRLEIDRTAFNPITRLPVLFGSSLKGAIRTALLDAANGGQSAPEKKGLHEFQGRLFRYREQRLLLERDPMRLVQIGDAMWQGEPGLPAAEVHLAVNRKKAPVVDERGRLRASQAEQRGLYQILECVPALHYRAFAARLNIQRVDGMGNAGELPDSGLRFDIRRIARACNDFYRPILMTENQLLADRGFLRESWRRTIEALLTGEVGETLERGEAFLLRVGRHSGAESVTVNGVRNIKIMKARGQPPEYASSAKTVWLAAGERDQRKDMLPFGWLLVEILPADSQQPHESDTLKTACEMHLASARAWAARQAEKASARAQAQAAQEARRQQEEEQARLRAEQAARAAQAEAERQARLAAMSEEERAIEELRTWLEADKAAGRNEPQGRLTNRLAELMRQAGAWEPAVRSQLADLAEAIYGFVGWGSGKKKQERKARITELRSGK
ncbi:MAG TPA: RAMP superfamily CRISPR-associated protein [Candidatus Competibacteraceae bacterium]|nr:RAMP superfamily CRISPR-associated protein [Candidatus Competibacteraceae bacterium]